jgi:uncharacterized membrane protein YvbJ
VSGHAKNQDAMNQTSQQQTNVNKYREFKKKNLIQAICLLFLLILIMIAFYTFG